MDPYFRVRCPRSGCFWACFALEVAIRFEFEPRPLGRLRRFFRLCSRELPPLTGARPRTEGRFRGPEGGRRDGSRWTPIY